MSWFKSRLQLRNAVLEHLQADKRKSQKAKWNANYTGTPRPVPSKVSTVLPQGGLTRKFR